MEMKKTESSVSLIAHEGFTKFLSTIQILNLEFQKRGEHLYTFCLTLKDFQFDDLKLAVATSLLFVIIHLCKLLFLLVF